MVDVGGARDVDRAIDRGCAFLAAAQGSDGMWQDSELDGAGSDFVTAYIARCLWAVLSMPGREDLYPLFEAACQGLSRRQRRNGGWAYSAQTATDAEATSWALLCLLDQRDRRGFSTARAKTYLEAHRDPSTGGYRPYLIPVDSEGETEFLRVPDVLCEAQPCVTGSVVRALVTSAGSQARVEEACRYLRRAQQDDGLWTSALWNSRGAPTYLALSALDMTGSLSEEIREAARVGVEKLLAEAEGYELTASLVAAPRLYPTGAVLGEAVERLLAEQRDDGGWTPPSRIRALSPVPAASRPDGSSGPNLHYRGRLLMTVTAVTGLYFSAGAAADGYRAYLTRLAASTPEARPADGTTGT